MMKKWSWSNRTFLRYVLYQVPSWGLLTLILYLFNAWVNLPAWLTYGILVLWVIKDALLFPLVWRAYERGCSKSVHSMTGLQGIVERRLDPSGYVWIHGELWQAEKLGREGSIEKGETVMVEGSRGLVLLVEAKGRKEPSPNDNPNPQQRIPR